MLKHSFSTVCVNFTQFRYTKLLQIRKRRIQIDTVPFNQNVRRCRDGNIFGCITRGRFIRVLRSSNINRVCRAMFFLLSSDINVLVKSDLMFASDAAGGAASMPSDTATRTPRMFLAASSRTNGQSSAFSSLSVSVASSQNKRKSEI